MATATASTAASLYKSFYCGVPINLTIYNSNVYDIKIINLYFFSIIKYIKKLLKIPSYILKRV